MRRRRLRRNVQCGGDGSIVVVVVPLMLMRARQAASLIKESSLARVSGVAVIGNEGGKKCKITRSAKGVARERNNPESWKTNTARGRPATYRYRGLTYYTDDDGRVRRAIRSTPLVAAARVRPS